MPLFCFLRLTHALITQLAVEATPPVAERIDHITSSFHSDNWNDPYYWLRDIENPKVKEYLHAENAYCDAKIKHTIPLQQKLFQEMKSRIRESDSDVPYRSGEWYYYSRTLEGKEYSILCRKKDDPDIGREEILLDLNVLAEGKEFLALGDSSVSPDGYHFAYTLDEDGDEEYDIFFKDLRTGKVLPYSIPGADAEIEWANDNKTIFYAKIDDTHRPHQIWKHVLGTSPEHDQLIYEEKDGRFYLGLAKSKDLKYIFIQCSATLTSEFLYLDANKPHDSFQIFATRIQGVEYDLNHHNDTWVINTNANNAKNFKLMTVPVSDYVLDDFSSWKEAIPHRPDVKLDFVSCFDKFWAIWEREKGFTKLRIKNLLTGLFSTVEFPETSYKVTPYHNRESDAVILSIVYSSLVTPSTVIDYNMSDGTRITKKELPVQGYRRELYTTERKYANAADGTLIPISIVYKKGLERDGGNPTLLYGYGSYGSCSDPQFDANIIPLLDRGFIYAIGHIRGGGEMGRAWYEAGKLFKKKNTFEDFVACAKFLISQKYTNPQKLAIHGVSAGGLLMGAVINMAPELFKAVIAEVPFVDVMNTMLDPSLPLVENEYEEWGNPNVKEDFEYMNSYAPYENVAKKAYPAILATAGLNDPRVPFWEPVKWVAKLRHMKTDSNVILLKTKMGQGHMGASGRFEYLKEIALNWAFIIDQIQGA